MAVTGRPDVPFWGSIGDEPSRFVLVGAPLDLTGSGRRGTREGPAAIRGASHHVESYSPDQDVDLHECRLADAGDIDLTDLSIEDALASIERVVSEILVDRVPVVLGGEHTLSLAVGRAVLDRYSDGWVLSLDAHLDLADELDGVRLAHGTWAARLVDEASERAVGVMGARSGIRQEWERASTLEYFSRDFVLPSDLPVDLRRRPVHVSIDVDVVDPSAAPGTGCPEPGGVTSRELLAWVRDLGALNVVALDVNEVLPSADPGGITSALAAVVVRESVIAIHKSRL